MATEKDAWNKVSLARAEIDTRWTDAVDYARRGFDSAHGQTTEWIGQAKELWTVNSEKVVDYANSLWKK